MNVILIVVQIIASIALIGLILMQQGKGADAGASFGAGASQTFFGSAGSANAITKLTALFATIFFLASLGLAYVAREDDRTGLQRELSEQLAPAGAQQGDTANTGLAPVEDASDESVNQGLAPSSDAPENTVSPAMDTETPEEAAPAPDNSNQNPEETAEPANSQANQ